MSVTFAVSEVEPATRPWAAIPARGLVETLAGGPVEALSSTGTVAETPRGHQLYAAVSRAFDEHFPVVLTPDAIWITMMQGLARHIALDPEKRRKAFVTFEGRAEIVIRRDEFVRGSPTNDWHGALNSFSTEIRKEIGDDNHRMIVADFSTTGPTERAASEVALMDAMQNYFSFSMYTLCGIPSVTLEGTPADWERLRDKANMLAGLDLDWWVAAIRPVLDGFVAAARGEADREWWRSMYNFNDESGGPYVTGWLTWLLPYTIRDTRDQSIWRNPLLGRLENNFGGLTGEQIPSSLSRAPFVWEYLGQRLSYELVSGIFGSTQDPVTFALRPTVGWAVRQRR